MGPPLYSTYRKCQPEVSIPRDLITRSRTHPITSSRRLIPRLPRTWMMNTPIVTPPRATLMGPCLRSEIPPLRLLLLFRHSPRLKDALSASPPRQYTREIPPLRLLLLFRHSPRLKDALSATGYSNLHSHNHGLSDYSAASFARG